MARHVIARDGIRAPDIDAMRARALQYLRALVAHLGRSAQRIQTTIGVTNAQLFVLSQIADGVRLGSPLSIRDVAERALTRQNTASAVVARLVDARLVRSVPAAGDRRRRELTLTPRGRALLDRAPESPTARVVTALRKLSPSEARTVTRGLGELVRVLGVDVAQPPMLFEEPARPPARSSR